MNDKIIKSSVKIKRNPVIAFLLSFFFTGSGEIYSGELLKGLIIFALKIITILILPLIIYIKISDSYLFPFIITISIALSLHLFSAVFAAYKTYQKKTSALKKYNNIFFYLVFFILNAIISIYAATIILTSYGYIIIENEDNFPSITKGDIVLYLKYLPHGLNKGDLILSDNGSLKRILARENENFKISKDKILIDNFPLEREILSEYDLRNYSIEFGEKIVFEINNRKKYPVVSDESILSKLSIKESTVKTDKFLTGCDNRLLNNQIEEIKTGKIKGRIEGIFFSKNLKRIFAMTFESIKSN